MGAMIDITDWGLWYRVFHPDFNVEKAYMGLAYIDYGESAWSQILFINEEGMTYALSVQHTVCVRHYQTLQRDLTLEEKERYKKIPKSRKKDD